MTKDRHFYFSVVGYPYLTNASARASYYYAQEGMDLRLEPEPSNPYDPNAVKVYDLETGERIGYMDRSAARDYRRLPPKLRGETAQVFRLPKFSDSGEVIHAMEALLLFSPS